MNYKIFYHRCDNGASRQTLLRIYCCSHNNLEHPCREPIYPSDRWRLLMSLQQMNSSRLYWSEMGIMNRSHFIGGSYLTNWPYLYTSEEIKVVRLCGLGFLRHCSKKVKIGVGWLVCLRVLTSLCVLTEAIGKKVEIYSLFWLAFFRLWLV